MTNDKNIETKKVLVEKTDVKIAYKAEGKRRNDLRKKKRLEKYIKNIAYNKKNATWYENGKCMQHCDYFGTCEFPCNGDC